MLTIKYWFLRLRSLPRLNQPIVGFALVLIVAIWTAVFTHIEADRRALVRDSEANVENLAIAFEHNVGRIIDDIDRLIMYLRETHERSGFQADWSKLIRERYTSSKEALQIAVTDADGILIATNIAALAGQRINLADREHVQVHARGTVDNLFISRPVLGRVSNKWTVQLTRRYPKPDGSFGGVIVVSLDPNYLSRAYGDMQLGPGSGLALVGTDDVLRAGTGPYAALLGRGLTETVFTGKRWSSSHGNSVHVWREQDEHRLVASRPVSGYPLYVMVTARDASQEPERLAVKTRYQIGACILTAITLIALFTSIFVRRRHESEITTLARLDSLTGLGNRAMFRDDLEAACQHRDHVVALHLIDLDRFKFVNDTYGHPVGDKLLKLVAERLLDNVRQDDRVARLGGDEFSILQIGLRRKDEADAMASRLVQVLSAPYEIDGFRMEVGASIGVALMPHDCAHASDLVKAADLALYSAKADGRNRHRFFEPGMDAAAQARREIETGLKIALEQNQFELHYQPINDISTKAVTGYEALVRWLHPERGLLPPGEFVPVAEETGLIVAIGAWVLRQACMDMATRSSHLKVAVNFSPIQFMDPQLVSVVKDALATSGLAPSRLEVEITESTLMRRDSLTIKHLTELRAIGVAILMDDFGTGYSSLSYLQTYPISCIKIDRSFIMSLADGKSSAAIVRAITTLANSLGMSTIAEGVETIDQLEVLRRLGCTEAQGYYFARPKPVDEIMPTEALPGNAPASKRAA